MRYFTLDWYHDSLVSQMCFSLRKSPKASTLNEKFFESLYKSEKNWYVRFCKRAARFSKVPFSKEAAEAEFDKNYKDNLEFINTLPSEITLKIADMRVFALGTVNYEMADEITRYCGQINRKCEAVANEYEATLNSLKKKLGDIKVDDLYLLKNAEILNARVVSEDLEIRSESNEFTLRLKSFSGDNLNDLAGAVIVAYELIEISDERFSLGLLCESSDGELVEIELSFNDFEIIAGI